jgi:hypothetical protein
VLGLVVVELEVPGDRLPGEADQEEREKMSERLLSATKQRTLEVGEADHPVHRDPGHDHEQVNREHDRHRR